MRIGIFASRILPKLGGAELVVDCLASRFARAGHSVVVIAPRPGWFSFPDDSKYPYSIYRYPPHLSKRYFVEQYSRYLKQAYAIHHFDILHCHDVFPQAYLAVRCQREIPVPIVLTSHGSDVMVTHGRYRVPSVLQRAKYAMRNVDVMIAVSDTMKENFLEMCPTGTRVQEISNGVDVQALRNQVVRPERLDTRIIPGKYFLYLGRLTKRKGVDTLLTALAAAPAQGGLELVIAGYGREQASLEALCAQLKLTERVIFVGAVSGAVKTYLLQNARATIVPTRTWEACSLVTLESFAAGTPVIGSSIQGVRHLIAPGSNGQLFEPGSAKELTALITEMNSQPQLLASWGKGAARAADSFDWDVIAKQHLDLFAELIAEREQPLPRTASQPV